MDGTSPQITPNVSGTLGDNNWYTSDVNVTWTVTDPDSQIASTSGCGPTPLTAETTGTNIQCQATSGGGSTISLLTIKIDKTDPTARPDGHSEPGRPGRYGHRRGERDRRDLLDRLAGLRHPVHGERWAPDGRLHRDRQRRQHRHRTGQLYGFAPDATASSPRSSAAPASTTINGTNGNDVIVDTSGNNTIQAGAGIDTICTGNGADKVFADDGNDWVDAGGGKNVVKGGNGNDTIATGSADDNVDGGSGTDVINAGEGQNKVVGGDGNDQITTGSGNDQIDGGKNVDTCSAGGGTNKIKNCEVVT